MPHYISEQLETMNKKYSALEGFQYIHAESSIKKVKSNNLPQIYPTRSVNLSKLILNNVPNTFFDCLGR